MSYIGNSLPANFQSLPAVQRFNGTGSATEFTLAAQIANDQSILVSVDGVTQDSNAYAVSGTTLTFTAAPSAGTGNIFVNTISPVGSTVVPPDGSVTTAKIANGAVTAEKIADGAVSVVAVQTTAPSSPAEGDIWFNSSASTVSGIVSKAMANYSGSKWEQMSNRFSATGGTVTTYGAYTVHTFTSSGTFAIDGGAGDVDMLIVAGGGGGGASTADAAGGGAGGVLVASALSQEVGSYTVTIGAGGGSKANGADSSFSTYVAKGGGYGNNAAGAGNAGGSGGGGGGDGSATDHAGGASTQSSNVPAGFTGYGNAGGIGNNDGGSGGGAGAVGGAANTGVGGIGIQNLFRTGSNVYYGGGGGGGGETGGSRAGGLGGGATSPASGAGNNGTANTGGGGSGADNNTGGSGGSGIVVVRYLT